MLAVNQRRNGAQPRQPHITPIRKMPLKARAGHGFAVFMAPKNANLTLIILYVQHMTAEIDSQYY